jgi:hypothetical protein
MKKIFVLLFAVLFSVTSLYSQNDSLIVSASDTVTITKTGLGYSYSRNGNPLTLNDISSLVKMNSAANSSFKAAKGISTFANILGGAGGYCIGYPLGTALAGGQANWNLLYIGAGLVAVALPIVGLAEKKLKQAMELYNQSVHQTSSIQYELKLKLDPSGFGLCMTF